MKNCKETVTKTKYSVSNKLTFYASIKPKKGTLVFIPNFIMKLKKKLQFIQKRPYQFLKNLHIVDNFNKLPQSKQNIKKKIQNKQLKNKQKIVKYKQKLYYPKSKKKNHNTNNHLASEISQKILQKFYSAI